MVIATFIRTNGMQIEVTLLKDTIVRFAKLWSLELVGIREDEMH